MRRQRLYLFALVAGLTLSLLSASFAQRRAPAHYSDIMGCETRCMVAAAGWPFAFIRDYPGMSVGNRASLFDAALGADRFDWPPFLLDMIFWGGLAMFAGRLSTKRDG